MTSIRKKSRAHTSSAFLRSIAALTATLTLAALCAVLGSPSATAEAAAPPFALPAAGTDIGSADIAALHASANAGDAVTTTSQLLAQKDGFHSSSSDLLSSDGVTSYEVFTSDTVAAAAAIEAAGGTVTGEIVGTLVQADLGPVAAAELETLSWVRDVREPSISYPLYAGDTVPNTDPVDAGSAQAAGAGSKVGEHVVKMKAPHWQTLGLTGEGVKVGVIDYFGDPYLSNAIASGDLPRLSGTFCRFNGRSCSITDANIQHGVAVGEVIYDMAPDAELYFASALSTADLKAAVDYFIANDVDIVSRSLTARYDGAGDGTGPLADVIKYAVDNGVTWFNSAGNNAGSTDSGRYGSYWRGTWADADGDGWMEFAPGDESMGFAACFLNGLRWSDWGDANATDYDWYVYDNPTGTGTPRFVSLGAQGNGQDPLEAISGTSCGEVLYMKIRLAATNNGTSNDVLEVMGNSAIFEYWQNPYSASGPGSDLFLNGHVSVGAIDPPNGKAIAQYSSQGPTNSGRLVPELSGAACLKTSAYGLQCFNGTSSSTPAVAGAAALVLSSGIAKSPGQVEAYLKSTATDRGTKGKDNVFGFGEVQLESLRCNGRNATIIGSAGRDTITGTPGNDVIVALGGNDRVRGGGGNDIICGGAGKDKLYGQGGNDYLSGGAGRDLLDGGNNNDKLYGGKSRDSLRGRGGSDLLVGGSGGDSLDGGRGRDACHFFSITKTKAEAKDSSKRCEAGK